MENQDAEWHQKRARSELLLRFFKAYDDNNDDVMHAILDQAEKDNRLKQLIGEQLPIYISEEENIPLFEARERFSILINRVYLIERGKLAHTSLLTIARVAAQLQVDFTLQRGLPKDLRAHQQTVLSALSILVDMKEPFPIPVTRSFIETILQREHIAVPNQFVTVFFNTASHLQRARSA